MRVSPRIPWSCKPSETAPNSGKTGLRQAPASFMIYSAQRLFRKNDRNFIPPDGINEWRGTGGVVHAESLLEVTSMLRGNKFLLAVTVILFALGGAAVFTSLDCGGGGSSSSSNLPAVSTTPSTPSVSSTPKNGFFGMTVGLL